MTQIKTMLFQNPVHATSTIIDVIVIKTLQKCKGEDIMK